jgi:predicted HAD superfamily Cof-like phosphohydrolase
MKREIDMVAEFMQANGYPPPSHPTATLPPEILLQRLHLMMEELGDVSRGLNERDLILLADGLCDLLYVVYGTAVATGLGPILPHLFAEVHRSNMTKELGKVTDGRRGALKGPGYEPPRLAEILDNYQDQLRQISESSLGLCDARYGALSRVFCTKARGHEGSHINDRAGLLWTD